MSFMGFLHSIFQAIGDRINSQVFTIFIGYSLTINRKFMLKWYSITLCFGVNSVEVNGCIIK